MKGARRTRKTREQAGFANLMAPPHPTTSMRGVVTGVSRAQPTLSTSNPTTPNPVTPDPTTPPPLEEDWGSLLQTTPKRKMSPQKPIVATSPNSSPSTNLSPTTNERHTFSPKPVNVASTSVPVPAFLSGWDGADGWGDDPSLDDSDQDIQEDPWGVWPDSDDLLSSRPELTSDPVSVNQPDLPNSEQQQSQHLPLKTPSTTNVLGDLSAVSPNTPPVPHAEESVPLQHTESPQPVTSREAQSETTCTEAFNRKTDEYHRVSAGDGGATCLGPTVEGLSQSGANEIFYEDEPLQPTAISVHEQQPEESPHRETVIAKDTSDSRLELYFSGWKEAQTTDVEGDAEVFPHPENTQDKESPTTEETNCQFEPQTEHDLQCDDLKERVQTHVQTEAEDDGTGLKEVGGTNTGSSSDPVKSATTLTVVTSDKPHESLSAPLPTGSWGFEETGKDVPVDEAGWGWDEADNAPTANISDNEDICTNSTANTADVSNDFVSGSLKGNSPVANSASDERSREDVVQNGKPLPTEHQESKKVGDKADPFSSSQLRKAPEDGLDSVEESRETVTDDWGWGVQTEHSDAEFMVDSRTSIANIPPAVSAEDPVPQGSEYDSRHSRPQTEGQSSIVQGSHEEEDTAERSGIVGEENGQKLHGVKSAGADPLMAASISPDPDNANVTGVQQSEGTTLEAYDSFLVAGDRARSENVGESRTVDHDPVSSEHSTLPNEEGLSNGGSFRTTKAGADAWETEVRSTDVDVSSTIAGTDVPSVAAPSSVDEAEWDADRSELRVNAPSAADTTQNVEKLSPVATGGTPASVWGMHDHSSQTDRSWTNPDALWSSPPADSRSPVVADTPSGIVDQHAPAEEESRANETIARKDSTAANATMIGTVEEPSFWKVNDSSLSDNVPSYPRIDPRMFQHFPGNNVGAIPVMKTELNQQNELHETQEPGRFRSAEVRNTSEVPGVSQSEGQDGTQRMFQERRSTTSNIAGSFSTTEGKMSNSYWTERLDQSKAGKSDGSPQMSHTALTDLSGTKSDETEMETSLASSGTLRLRKDGLPEKNVVSMSLNTDSGISNQPSQLTAVATVTSDAVSGPSGNLQDHGFPDLASQLVPTQEPEYGASQNETVNVASPAVESNDFFHALEIAGGSTEAKAQNGPISGDGSQSFELTQNLQWPSESMVVEDGDGSNYFASLQDGHNIESNSNMQFDRYPGQDSVSGEMSKVLSHGDNNCLSVYNQRAPRLTSSPARDLFAESISEVIPPPPAKAPSDNQLENISRTESVPHNTAIYDPFSGSQEDPMREQTKHSGEAFDWNFSRAPEPMLGAQSSLPSVYEETQAHIEPSPRSPQTHVNMETKTGHNARQTVALSGEDSKFLSMLSLPQDSQASRGVEAVGDLDEGFVGRNAISPEDEPRRPSAQGDARRIEDDVEEFAVGRHQSFEDPRVDMTRPASDPQRSPKDVVGLHRYAPRQVQSAETESDISAEVPSSSVGREPLDSSAANENTLSVPFAAASSAVAYSDPSVPKEGPMPVSYQSLQPESSSHFEANVAEALLPTHSSSSGRRDLQFHQREKEVFSAHAHGALSASEHIHTNHSARSRSPPPTLSDLPLDHERAQVPIPSTTKPEGNDLRESLLAYPGDHSVHRTRGLAYAPVRKETHGHIPQEVGAESDESKQHALSVHSIEVNPSSLSSSPYVTQAAYANVTGPARSPGGNDVPSPKNTFIESQGSYDIAGEFSLGYSVPQPPRQASFPPPAIPNNQEVFPPESMVDPSTFSYPYSILDTETSGDESCRPQRPLVSWGFGGRLVTVIPPLNGTPTEYGLRTEIKGSSTVHIHDLTAISHDGSNDDWAAASEAVSPLSLPVRPPDLLAYADMCDRLSKLSAGLSGSDSEGRAAMWRILALLCRQGTSEWRANAPTAICGPSSVPMIGRNTGSFISGKSKFQSPLRGTEPISPTSEHEKNEAAAEVERLLAVGNGVEAIRVAREAGLWSIALVLAGTIDKSLYMRVVSEFAKSTLQDGSAVQTLCLSTAEDESEILRKTTSSSGLKEWRKTVGMLLTTRRSSPNTGKDHHSTFLRLIDRIGEALISERNDVLAGHVCFLLSGRLGPLDSTNVPLLGADLKKPAGRPRSIGSPAAVLQSLVFEAVANTQNGASYPHILPFRLLLAEEVCSVGRPDVALAHCESISSAVRDVFESGNRDISSKFFTLPFLSHLEALEQRLHAHLGLHVNETKKGGGLSSFGKSLSSVFTMSSTGDSRGSQLTPRENIERSARFAGPQRTPPLQPVPFTSASPQTPAFTSSSSQTPGFSSANIPSKAAESQWTPTFEPSRLQPLHVDKSSAVQPDVQSGDVSGNERWNSLVSKTIGFIAPAEGDLSPPLKPRGDQGFPLHAQPTPLGLGTGTGHRAPSQDVHHMRSASVGDVPIMQSHGPIAQVHGQGAFSHVQQASPQNHRRNVHEIDSRSGNRAMMNGMPVQKATTTESVAVATHRRSASDMTFESQTSEKKPPRPPKKSPGLPPGIDLQPKKQNAPVVKGWRSRLSEKIRAAFNGPPRAHMGVENKFRYDKERGRWIMEGEDPNEDDEIPPPPPDDDAMVGEKPKVPFSQSYESLPNPDLGDQLMHHSNGANSEGADGLLGGGAGADNFRRYSNAQFDHNRAKENATSRDAGSESSVASAASAPVPYSSQPGISTSASSGNKFRAHPGRLSGRRAYVDTFNKGTPVSSIPASLPLASRPGVPSMPVLGSSNGNGYRIFTPNPVVSSDSKDSDARGRDVSQGTSNSIIESSDQMPRLQQETQASTIQQPGNSFGYGLSEPAPTTPSVEQYQANTRNENQPRLMA